jgi:hypothetical protein
LDKGASACDVIAIHDRASGLGRHTSELAIIYDRQVNGRPDRAAEILRFGLVGRVIQGEVFYGVAER